MKHHLSVDEQVTKDTPPTFLVHSMQDATSPVENSLLFFQAMRRAKAPIEMHLYPNGRMAPAWTRSSGRSPSGRSTANRGCDSTAGCRSSAGL